MGLSMDKRTATGCIVATLIALGVPTAFASDWNQLGPSGGNVQSLAVAKGTGRIYAAAASLATQVFRSDDSGLTWSIATPPPACDLRYGLELSVRVDGDVVGRCVARVVRSRDGMRTWSTFSPRGLEGAVAFDPRDPRRAVLRSTTNALYFTADDGATWTMQASAGVVPQAIAYDPVVAHRLVGVSDAGASPTGGASLGFVHESFDDGNSWRFVASFVVETVGCAVGKIAFDADGTLFFGSVCGVYRSSDRGTTWQAKGRPANANQIGPLRMDPSQVGHFATGWGGLVYESRDAGSTWTTMPPVSGNGVYDVAIDTAGDLYVGTDNGVRRFDRTQGLWINRSSGLNGNAAIAVEPTASGSILMMPQLGAEISTDGGVSWAATEIAGQRFTFLYRNITDSNSLLAYTLDSILYRSGDGGRTWSLVAAPATPGLVDQTYSRLVPVGPQPGLVYAIYSVCEPGQFTGCAWTPLDIVKSIDGGRTWQRTNSGVASPRTLTVSPANPSVIWARGSAGVFRSRDGGGQWERTAINLPLGGAIVADPRDAARWYAVAPYGRISTSADSGDHWTDAAPPYMVTFDVDLLIDPDQTERLYLVHTDGRISVSEDRGTHWRSAHSPTTPVTLSPGSARFQPGSHTIYTGSRQGVLRIDVDLNASPSATRAIEYYRPNFDHYFITADPSEIAALDSDVLTKVAFERTGFEFNVWPAGTQTAQGNPVCRFYGRPEAGLDSHFYSASPSECAAVQSRFAYAWIYESPDVFVAGLPDLDGTCAAGERPVYRLFNNRADANHRYVSVRSERDHMVTKGWIPEGYGPDGVAMCSPP